MKIIDMHCDTLGRLLGRRDGVERDLRHNDLHVDLEKMRKADYMAQIFAMFVPIGRTEDPLTPCMEMLDRFWTEMERNSDIIAWAGNAADIRKNDAEGKMSGLLGIEDSGIIGGSLANLRLMYRMGVRLITLSWNFENNVGSPNNTPEASAKGLKEHGIDFVREMGRLGMIVDVSHFSDAGFYDVCKYVDGPFVASHSNAREVTSHTRNLTDDMLRKLAEHGGVTGLNFCGPFVGDYHGDMYNAPTLETHVSNLVEHVKHIVKVAGIETAAIGTDFDGISDRPLEMEDAGCMPVLVDALSKAGFSDSELEKICWKNTLRVIEEVLR